MGYCTDHRGRLCCDFCGNAGGVRRVPCPFGYCPPVCACASCKKEHKSKLGKQAHVDFGCERSHNAFVAREQATAENHKRGIYTLKSAIGLFDGAGRVRVTFWLGKPETYKDFILADELYSQRFAFRDERGDTTLEHFQSLGECIPCADGMNLGTKQRVVS